MLRTAEARKRIVEEARRFLQTPYHHMGRVRDAGIDCATLILEVYEQAGITPHIEIPYYSRQWNCHRSEELYLAAIVRHGGREIRHLPEPGDLAVFREGRTYSHGAIVVKWPEVIHATDPEGVTIADAMREPLVSRRVRFFSLFE